MPVLLFNSIETRYLQKHTAILGEKSAFSKNFEPSPLRKWGYQSCANCPRGDENTLKIAGFVFLMPLKPWSRETKLENCREGWFRKYLRSRTFAREAIVRDMVFEYRFGFFRETTQLTSHIT